MKRILLLGLGISAVLSGCSYKLRPKPPGPVLWSDYSVPQERQQDLPDLSRSPLKLSDVLHTALGTNAGLHAAERRWNAARLVPDQASSLPDPMISLNRFVDEVVTRNGAIEWQGMLQQRIPFPGKLGLRGDIAEQAALMAWEGYMAEGLRLAAEVKKSYYEYYWIERSVEITDENRKLLEQVLEVAQTKYRAGQVTQQDVLKTQIELAKLNEDLNTLRDLLETTRARLNRSLNRTDDAVLGSPAKFEVSVYETDIDTLYQQALKDRPEIRAADHAIEKARRKEELAKLDYWPDFVVSGQYSSIEDIDLAGATESGEDAWGVGIGITLPLWWGKRDAALEESREMVEAGKLARRQLEHDTRYEITTTYYRLQMAFRQVRLYRDTVVPQAKQALSVAQTGYRAVPAKVDFESVIDNQKRLLNFQLALERARSDFQQRMADLERIVGAFLTEGDKDE
jgi:outer membrane protein TolC